MPTISRNKNASPPTTARLNTGDRIIAYDVYLKDGKYTVNCDICSQAIVVGKGANTYNLGSHRSACLQRQITPNATVQPHALATPSTLQFQSFSSHFQSESHTQSVVLHAADPYDPIKNTPSDSREYTDLSDAAVSDILMSEVSDSIANMNLYETGSGSGSGTSNSNLGPSFTPEKEIECGGTFVLWEPGTVWTNYSFAMHTNLKNRLPWDLIRTVPDGSGIYIRAHGCLSILMHQNEIDSKCCNVCRNIPNQRKFTDVMAPSGKWSSVNK
ncbi:hypothetical protein F5876DRAFT_84544 [Lentinula aff. lateritia]|uniref:Uncharacterized protein n=1 Tax=Lentinula aff. lateritia TaxID=2804960 RepID=A0ACC1TGM8_9AGAR|nr:hypothetical protein F5876DRAFT_84544 [Lentinula aff. lateritia]